CLVVHESDCRDIGFDDMDLLQWGHDQQLQSQPPEETERESGRLIGTATESLVDHYEPEGLRLAHAPIELELVCQRRRENRVGKLLLLATGFATRVGVVLVF